MLWVEVLNRALDWQDNQVVAGDRHAARVLDGGALGAARANVMLLRRVFASQYIDTPLTHTDVTALNQWLAAVTLRLAPAQTVRGGFGLQAARTNRTRGGLLEKSLSCALIQLLAQPQSRDAATAVHRCHGVLRRRRSRDAGDEDASHESVWPPEFEESFAQAAGITPLLRNGAWHQCPRLVVSERGSRYCSKTCSNAHFVARKSQTDPAYFAQKQRRYRRRREEVPVVGPARSDRGAFVYMD